MFANKPYQLIMGDDTTTSDEPEKSRLSLNYDEISERGLRLPSNDNGGSKKSISWKLMVWVLIALGLVGLFIYY